MKAPKLPPTPDPYVVSDAQTQSNQDTASYNNAITHGNTTTPYGNQTYTPRIDPTTGATVYDQEITVDQSVQDAINAQNQQDLALANTGTKMLGSVDRQMGTPLDTSGFMQVGGAPAPQAYQQSLDTSNLPELQGLSADGLPQLYGADDLMGARNQVSDALYRQQSSYLDPQYQNQDQALRTELANKGVAEGSEAWNRMRDEFSRNKSFDYSRARDSAITGSGQELSRLAQIAQANRGQLFGERGAIASNAASNRGQLFGERQAAGDFYNQAAGAGNATSLQNAGFNNNAAAQQLAQAMAIRSQPLNELNALRSASQVSVPQFANAQNAQSGNTDVAGNIWNAYNANSQAAQLRAGAQNGLMNGLFGLGSAALGNTSLFGKILG
mgnify:FL=1